MIRTLGAAQVDCSVWSRAFAYLDSSVSLSDALVNDWQCGAYGSIPSPGTPAPRAPQTQAQMTTPGAWTPAQTTNTGQDWADATDAKIQQAIDDGSYNPSGNLPFTATQAADFWAAYKWPLIIGAVGLGALVLFEAVKLR